MRKQFARLNLLHQTKTPRGDDLVVVRQSDR